MSTFYLFSQYTHDLSRTLNGLCQIYPSRYLAFTIKNEANIEELVASVSDKMDGALSTAVEDQVDYGQIRYEAWKALYPVLSENPVVGDVNFLSNDVQGGVMYSDIYVHVSPNDAKKTVILQELSNADTPTEPAFDHDGEGNIRYEPIERSEATWNAILIYYNLYQVDPRHEDSLMAPLVLDMPLGIYVLDEPAKIKVSTSELFGNGTSWTTRICSRFISSSGSVALGNSEKSVEFGTLSKVLTEFGNIASIMKSVVRERQPGVSDPLNPAGSGMAYNDILSYLDEFRNERCVNVPYIRDNHWFVNGRDIGEVVNQDLVNSAITLEKLIEAVIHVVEMYPDYFKGDKGDTGPQGPRGDQGPKGDTGPQGPPGPKGDDGSDGIAWKPSVSDDGVLSWEQTNDPTLIPPSVIKGSDGFTWRPSVDVNGNLSWNMSDSKDFPAQQNIKGKDGKTWKPSIDSEGYIIWILSDSEEAPQKTKIEGTPGPPGPPGPAGDPGEQGGKGETGPQGPRGWMWRPSVDANGWLSWQLDKNNSETPPDKFLLGGGGGGGCSCPSLEDIWLYIQGKIQALMADNVHTITLAAGQDSATIDINTINGKKEKIADDLPYTIDYSDASQTVNNPTTLR